MFIILNYCFLKKVRMLPNILVANYISFSDIKFDDAAVTEKLITNSIAMIKVDKMNRTQLRVQIV